MQKTSALKPEKRTHTRPQALIFQAKAFLLQLKRGAANLLNPQINRFPKTENLFNQPSIAESKTPLWTESAPAEQFLLAANKIPVIASKACGVENVGGIKTIETGNAEILRREIENILKPKEKFLKNKAPVFV